MPRSACFDPHFRPTYGFEVFDQLVLQLREATPDAATLATVLDALQLDGRQLDVDELAAELDLDPLVASIVERLAGWGDNGLLTHEFASICIATINAGSSVGSTAMSTFVFAQRCDPGIAFFYADENGGRGDLGVRDQPLSMLEAVVMIDAVLLAQRPYLVPSDDWRDAYFVSVQ